jgi:uncharacterized protein (DUF305 family)
MLIVLCAGASAQTSPGSGDPAAVQPGAPGQPTRTLPAGTAAAIQRPPTEADVKFMQGMIMHHSQAVEMTELLKTRSHNPDVQNLGKRIDISQADEIGFMKRWLQDRGEPLMPKMDMGGMDMAGMDMSKMDMSSMMPAMPGMLTAAQMEALRKATGPQFDHLFLTGMIQHHTGALTMVKELFSTPGAAQDPLLFDFTSDVENTQQAEIDIMRNLLSKEKK